MFFLCFLIVFFLTVSIVEGSEIRSNYTPESIKLVKEKPWLGPHLSLGRPERVQGCKITSVIDQKVFNGTLYQIISGCHVTNKNETRVFLINDGPQSKVIQLPFSITSAILLDPNTYVRDGGVLACRLDGDELWSNPISWFIPIFFKVNHGIRFDDTIFWIDKYGYLFASRLNAQTNQWTTNQHYTCELGKEWFQTRFRYCSKSCDGKSIYLETMDGRILEMPILDSDPNFNFAKWYPRLFRTVQQLRDEILKGNADTTLTLGCFIDRLPLPFYQTIPDQLFRLYLRLCNEPLLQSRAWKVLFLVSLLLIQGRLGRSIALLATIAALIWRNRKFLLGKLRGESGDQVYLPIEEIFD